MTTKNKHERTCLNNKTKTIITCSTLLFTITPTLMAATITTKAIIMIDDVLKVMHIHILSRVCRETRVGEVQ